MLALVLKLRERYNATIIHTANKHLAGSNSQQTSHVLNIRDLKIVGVSCQLQGIERYRKSSAKLNKGIMISYNECIDCSVRISSSQYFLP